MYTVEEICNTASQCQAGIDNMYVPARPIPFGGWTYRLKDAWEVFMGRADAVKWYKQ